MMAMRMQHTKEALDKVLYFRIAELLNLDMEVVFYDTTSLHFEFDEEDTGVGKDDEVRGSRSLATLLKLGWAPGDLGTRASTRNGLNCL